MLHYSKIQNNAVLISKTDNTYVKIQHLQKVRNGVLWLFVQEHVATRYRSRLWFLLPVLFNIPGGILAFFALRHDDMDKAKNCLLIGLLVFFIQVIPLILVGILVSELAVAEFMAENKLL